MFMGTVILILKTALVLAAGTAPIMAHRTATATVKSSKAAMTVAPTVVMTVATASSRFATASGTSAEPAAWVAAAKMSTIYLLLKDAQETTRTHQMTVTAAKVAIITFQDFLETIGIIIFAKQAAEEFLRSLTNQKKTIYLTLCWCPDHSAFSSNVVSIATR